MTGTTDWVSAVAILASGLILGGLVWYFVARRRSSAPTVDSDLELRDLEAKRDALVQQIRELDDLAPKLGAAKAAEERTRLELATAQVLRAIDTHKRAPAKAKKAGTEPAAVPPRPPSQFVGFVWGAASMIAIVLLGYFVMQSSKPREEGQGATGGTMQQAAPQPTPPDAETQRLEAAVAKEPANLDLRIELARAYLERENLMGVYDQTAYVLAKSPNDSRALTYQGLVRMAMGQSAEAAGMLDKATKIDPKLIDAWVALAWIRVQDGDEKGAEKAITEAQKQHPEEKQRLADVFVQMKERAKQAPAQMAEAGSNLPPGHPPITADSPRVGPARANAAEPSGASSTGGVHITITGPSRGGTLFVLARAAGVSAGPPAAVKRLNVSSLPITVDLSAADSMMGQPLPPSMRVEARLDSDGNAMTKDPGDPTAVQDGVSAGASITLALK